MSAGNVERVRQALEAINPPRDVEGFIAFCAQGVEFHSAFAAVGGAVYHGADGLRQWDRELDEAWEEISNTPEAFFDLGEHTLVFGVLRARGSHSGLETTMPVAWVFRSRDERLFYGKVYAQRKDALSDLGISEQKLQGRLSV
jgi:ketosteroid isomerase-like protein